MIDTIRLTCKRPLKADALEALTNKRDPLVSGWKSARPYAQALRWIAREKPEKENERKAPFILTHEPTGLRCEGLQGDILVLQVSFPRLIHRSNGILIKNPAELQVAHYLLNQLLDDISDPPATTYPYNEVKRLDLVLNLAHPPKVLLPMHRHIKHPWVRKGARTYEDDRTHVDENGECIAKEISTPTSVERNGSLMKMLLYDKKAMYRGNHGFKDISESICTRIEFQLKTTPVIKRALSLYDGAVFPDAKDPDLDNETADWLVSEFRKPITHLNNFGHLYRVWRFLLLKTQKLQEMPDRKPTLFDMIALNESQGIKLHGETSAYDWYCKYHDDRRRKDLDRHISKMVLPMNGFSWEKELPDVHPPTVVDVYPDGKEVEVPWEEQWHIKNIEALHAQYPGAF